MIEYILYWLIAANLIAFVLMIVDKQRAERGDWRISEATLLGWAMLGGAIGTFSASRLIRHKTRKQPFAAQMILFLIVEILLLSLWVTGILEPLVVSTLAGITPSA